MTRGQRRWWGLVSGVMVLAATVHAQTARPVVMPVPLELKGAGLSDADRERLSREFRRLLKLAGTAAPDLSRADEAVTALSAAGCESNDACVAAWAAKAEALYAVFATIERSPDGGVVAVGRVVRDDGVVVRSRATVSQPPGPFIDTARVALTELFRVLNVGGLSPVRVIEKEVTVVVPTPVEVPVPQPAMPPSPVVPAPAPRGVGLVVAGGASFLAGLIVLAATGLPALSVRGSGSPPVAASVGEANTLFVGYVGSIVGFALVGAGAVAGGLGALLWASSPGPRVGVAVGSSGVSVSLGGVF
jgi:hypothetical protein